MRALSLVLVVLTFGLAVGDAEARKPRRGKSEGLPLKFRFGASIDGARNIEFGDKATNISDNAMLGANLGVSYVGIERLSLDVDLELVMNLLRDEKRNEDFFDRLQVTLGSRFDLLDNIYLRAGVPFVVYPEANFGLLGGVGWRQSMGGSVGGFAEVGYERYFVRGGELVGDGESRIVLRGGIEAG